MIAKLVSGRALGCALLSTSLAAAQDRPATGSLTPNVNAVELDVGTGYAQGFGKVADGVPSLTDTGGAGAGFDVGVGYRLLPRLALGLFSTTAFLARGDNVDHSASVHTSTAGGEATLHLMPSRAIDPWISLGTGWRGYWVNANAGTTTMHGWELARLRVGAELRFSQYVSVSPVIGADLTLFLIDQTPVVSQSSIVGPNVTPFVFAGVVGRFDFPLRSPDAVDVAAR